MKPGTLAPIVCSAALASACAQGPTAELSWSPDAQAAGPDGGSSSIIRDMPDASAHEASGNPQGNDAGFGTDATFGGDDASTGDDASEQPETSDSCQGTGMMSCGATCTDTTSDALNCGACGHSCQGGACFMSVCSATVVSAQFVPPGRMTIDANNAYWTNGDGTIRAAPLSGNGATTTLAQGLPGPMGIAVDTQYVFAAAQGGEVVRAPLDGSAALDGAATLDVLASSQPTPYALTVDATNVYWSNIASGAGNGSIMSCPKTGCVAGAATLTSGIHVQYPYGIATTGGVVYWTSFNFGGELNTVPTTGGGMSTVGTNLGYPYEVAISGSTVLAVLYGQGGGVATLSTTGSGPPYHVAGGQSFPTEGTTDGTSAYWTLTIPSSQNGATLMKCSLSSGLPQVLATGVQPAGSVAVDGTWVYWLSNLGQVLKTAK